MTTSERFHALDAIRAFALLLGVVLHAAMSFLPGFGITGIPLIDNSPSTTLAVIFFTIHMFRMVLFFFIAGFFGHLLFKRLGLSQFIRNRLIRIAVPLVVGWPFVLTLIIVSFAVAYDPKSATTPATPPPDAEKVPFYFPLTHLWFLYVLLWMYTLVLLARPVFSLVFDRGGRGRTVADTLVRNIAAAWWGPVVLATPVCLALLSQKQWVMWFGVPTPDNSLLPNLTAFKGFFVAFTFGWLAHRQVELLKVWQSRWQWNLGAAVCLTITTLLITGPAPTYTPAERDGVMVTCAITYCLATWYWTFGLIGAGLQFCSNHSPRLRYLADASYWIYLIHLPVVFLAQAIVMKWNLHWTVKFPLILGVTLPLMLLSYHYLVRSTFIGSVLNGRRFPRKTIVETAPDCS